MATFKEVHRQNEQQVIVRMLSQIETNSALTQRSMASELDIALGLMNQYLKLCISKGWIRATKVSPRRIRYFLTPEGFAEKSRMVTKYLTRSLAFFKDARIQCEDVFAECEKRDWFNICLFGPSDLADIAKLVAGETRLRVTAIQDLDQLKNFDAVLITDISKPQAAYLKVRGLIESKRIFTLPLSHISRIQFNNEVLQ
jgi:hypothetical protein